MTDVASRPLDADGIAKELGRPLWVGKSIVVLEEVGSTNDLAHERSTDPTAAGGVIFSERQSAGRGQRASTWSAPARSSLLFSFPFFPPKELEAPNFLTAWVAGAVALALQPYVQTLLTVKWPNDVLLSGKKVCGILVERRHATVVGVGVNVAIADNEFPPNLRMPATSIAAHANGPIDRNQLAVALIRRLDACFAEAVTMGPDAVYETWESLSDLKPGEFVQASTRTQNFLGVLVQLSPKTGAKLFVDGEIQEIAPLELVRVERPSSTGKNRQ